ncbi:MAG: 3'-5' exonuclease [Flavobacteriales bacterium]
MLSHVKPGNILFLDIETVPLKYTFNELNTHEKYLWESKNRHLITEDNTAEKIYQKAGIYAEFGKIICICTGVLIEKGKKKSLRIKSFSGDDEKKLLLEFAALLHTHFNKPPQHTLCAHNGKEFDFPYICRRMLINGIPLPEILDIAGKKPWETGFLDTMELWKFGDYKSFTSLELLAGVFGIPTPKDDIKGEDVKRVYYEEKDLNRITAYCRKDVLTIVQLFLKYRCQEVVAEEDVTFV